MSTLANTLLLVLRGPFEAARHYTARKFRQDIVAGLTVAVVAVPQSMAYAIIAGVSPIYGLYTAIIQCVVASLLSSSSHLSTGPINTQSLLIASTIGRFAQLNSAEYLSLVLAMTVLQGLVQMAFAFSGVGHLVRYISHSVVVGFTAGAAILIAAGQVPSFLGISSNDARHLPGILGIFERMAPYLGQVRMPVLAIGAGSLALVIVCRMISRFVPGPLIATVMGGVIVWAMGAGGASIPQIGILPTGLPSPHLPDMGWATAEKLFGGALVLALVGMMEAYSIAKAIAARTGERLNPNQEFFGQGFANFVSGFFQCIPGSGSFSRTALNYQAGAQTCFSGVYNSIFVAAMFLLFAPWAQFIPKASLAAILFVIAYGLIDWRYMLRVLPASRPDAVVCIVTFLATLLIPLEFAIVVGIFLNVGLYVRTASRLHIEQIVQVPGGPFAEVPINDRAGGRQVMLLQMEGDLFFGVADELQDRLGELAKAPVRVIVFRLKGTHSMDATVLHVLESFVKDMRKTGRHLLLCGVRPDLAGILGSYGLLDLIGRDNVFEAGFGVFTSTRRALDRARELVGQSIDTEHIHFRDEPETVTYVI